MFSLFPDLFTYQLFAVTLLRVTAGYFFLLFAGHSFRALIRARGGGGLVRTLGAIYALTQFVAGMLLVVGLYTQGAAIAGVVLAVLPTGKRRTACEHHVHLLLFTLSAALLLLGPGAFAIDLPL